MYKESKWAKEIIDLQNDDGSWGYFHTLSEPGKKPITTEQALRRLNILGYTIRDEPIQKAVSHMNSCLSGKSQLPDRREKTHDWDIFTNLMLSAWIRKFSKDNPLANLNGLKWANTVTKAFSDGSYDYKKYMDAYEANFGKSPRGERLIDFVSFYQVSIISDLLDEETEYRVFDYILNHPSGIYYIYGSPLSVLPVRFDSIQSSRYLGAIELLSEYRRNNYKLKYVADWLNTKRRENGGWDMGNGINDKIYFPLSDSWRNKGAREADCIYRIQKLICTIDR